MPQLRGLPKEQWASPTPYKAQWKAFKKRWKEQYIPEVTEPFEFDWGALERPEEAGRLGLAQAKTMIAGASMPMHMKGGAITRRLGTKLVRRYPGKIRSVKDVRLIVRNLMKRARIKGYTAVEETPAWKEGFGTYQRVGKTAHKIGVKMKPSWRLETGEKGFFGGAKPPPKDIYYSPKWQRFPRGEIEDTMLHEVLHGRMPKSAYKLLGRKTSEGTVEGLTQALKKWAFLKRVPRGEIPWLK